MGSAAAALIFGAGVAHADENASTPSDRSSESSEQSDTSTATGPSATQNDTTSPIAASDDSSKTDVSETSPAVRKDDDEGTGNGRTLQNQAPSVDQLDATPASPAQSTDDDTTGAPEAELKAPETPAAEPKSEPTTPKVPQPPTPVVAPAGRQEDDADVRAPALAQPVPSRSTTATAVPLTTVAALPPLPNLPQLVRQLTGLTVDAAAFSASLVSAVAYQVAQTLGPNFLGGGPHYAALTIANFAADISRQVTGTPPTAAAGPFPVNYGVFNPLAWLNPYAIPPGANDPTITVTPAHPLPIILVNGTTETQAYNWSVGAPVLANAGYKVYSFAYGASTTIPGFPFGGVADIAQSAQQLSAQIDAVLAETGASQVILVGHSQGGGILPAYYMNVLGGADKVSQLIGIAPSNHGTDVNYAAYALTLPILGSLLTGLLSATLPALEQQSITSPFQQIVYGNGDTRPGVLYTTIVSTYDEVLTPYTQQFLDGPSVTNIVIQDQHPGFMGGHLSVLVNPAVWSYVLDALEANPAANPLLAPLAQIAV
ncbi:alpha/beta fold hydrolase [Mycolicibacterium lacusdiani]|uniref:alpha/beta fold hydrolase n=1 Tax=Mycolicibacterium lacusdiani TaxID=2895283 RepID=UPI001F185DC9|nr:alpha/beta fold hydrolase [Mycolicibacterium lacusdiani]